jgi:hypothetical protein
MVISKQKQKKRGRGRAWLAKQKARDYRTIRSE